MKNNYAKKTTNTGKLILTAVILNIAFVLLFGACKNNTETHDTTDCIELSVKDSAETEYQKPELWNFCEKKICVLFGYGYNDESFVTEIKKELSDSFGLAQDGGLVYPLVFPKDFKSGVRERISILAEYLENYELQGILLLGAPENTHNAVNYLIARYDGKLPFPVFSMFSQDNVLGTEWISDFVLEKVHVSDILSDGEEHSAPAAEDARSLIINAVKYISMLDLCGTGSSGSGTALPADSDLLVHVQNIAGKERKVSYYVDPDSGLRSVNHFVFQEDE